MRPVRSRQSRGSVMALIVVLSVVLTGLVMTLAWNASIEANMAGQIPKLDSGYYAAEAYGAQAVWKFKHDNSWRALPTSPWTIPNNTTPSLAAITMAGATWNGAITCVDAIGDATLAWKFDEGTGTATADATGNGNDGLFHGGVTWDTNGRSAGCVDLNGVDAFIDCGNNASTNLTGDMTFSAWIKMNSAFYDQKIGGNQSGTSGGYKLCVYNLKAEFEVRSPNNTPWLDRDVPNGTTLTLGTWYNITGVYSETNHTISTYLNGKFDRTLTGLPANALGSTTGNFIMGKEPWTGTSVRFFNGAIDDIRIFNRALSDAEVKTLYDTSVDIKAVATSGTATNFVKYTCSIPTPPAPTIPTITANSNFSIAGDNVTGDVSVNGKVSGGSPSATVMGNLNYTQNISNPNSVTVSGSKIKVSSVPLPAVNYAFLRSDATAYGRVEATDSVNETFAFNSVGGSKVIYIKGNLTDPTVTIGGVYASGGTFIIDGDLTFTKSATLGTPGYPIYFVVPNGSVTHSGGTLTLIGAIYTENNLSHQTLNITGPIYANGTISNNSGGVCTFLPSPIPWFDSRAVPQPSTGSSYFTSYRGVGP